VIADLLVRPALELATLVRAGEVSAIELVDAALRRMEHADAALHAFVSVQAELALERARTVSVGDERPFAGVPLALKDSAAQRGLPCPIGSALFRDHCPSHDDAAVRRLQDAGFIVIGRTAMPEFGILPTTEPRLTGPTRNPHDLSRTPGGSSGGAAAAVAAGIIPVAHGGDGGGSLRIPAACCGLVGLKPSRGRISAGPQAGDDPLVSDGGLTRTVADSAALLDVLAGYEPGDATWAPPPARPFLEAVRVADERPPRRLRVGLALTPPVPARLDPSCAQAAIDAAHALENLGHLVEETELPRLIERTREAFDDVWAVMAAEGVRGGEVLLGRQVTARDVEPLTWALYQRARGVDALRYRAAFAAIQRAAREFVIASGAYELIITPSLALPPVAVGTITGMLEPDPLDALARSDAFSPYTAVWNMTGQPALSLPVSTGADRLPRAAQLVGRPADDATVLAVARQLEQTLPSKGRPDTVAESR
jgi:amidase